MDNQDKNIDQLFSDKVNEYKADDRFAQMDFESIKASLPTAAPTIGIPKVKLGHWFGLNNLIVIAIGIIGIASLIYYWSNIGFGSKNDKEFTNSTQKLIADTSGSSSIVAANKNPLDTSIKITKQDNNTVLYKDNSAKNLATNKLKPNAPNNNKLIIDDNKANALIKQQFFSKLVSPTQLFIINSEKDTFLTCANGTQLDIKANTFTSFNQTIIKGIVQLEIREAYSFTDIIANGLHTVSNGNILASAGMIYMNATQNKLALDINIKKPMIVSIPTKRKVNGMQLFYLDKNANDNLLTAFSNWIANGQEQNLIQKNTYAFSIRNFGWMDCGHFNIVKQPKASLEIKLPNVEDSNTIRGMLVLPNSNSLINLRYSQEGFIKHNLPVGEEAYFIAFKIVDEKVFSIIQKITINEGIVIAEEFKHIPIAEVKAKLDAMGVAH